MPKINAATLAEHRERTGHALQDAALELALEHGYAAVTMRMIAERAGVLRTAVYNYAPDKLTLIVGGADRHSAELRDTIFTIADDSLGRASDRLRSLIHLLFVSFTESAHQLLLLRTIHFSLTETQRHAVTAPFKDDIGTYLKRILSDGVGSGDFAPIEDMDRIVKIAIAVFESVLGDLARSPEELPAIAETVSGFLINGLRPSKTRQ